MRRKPEKPAVDHFRFFKSVELADQSDAKESTHCEDDGEVDIEAD